MGKYTPHAIELTACRIVEMGDADGHGAVSMKLENGLWEVATQEECQRTMPKVGDYLAFFPEGRKVVVKSAFERTYKPI